MATKLLPIMGQRYIINNICMHKMINFNIDLTSKRHKTTHKVLLPLALRKYIRSENNTIKI